MKSTLRLALRDAEYVGPRTSRAIVGLLLFAGIIAAASGVGYALNGATQAPPTVTVPISIEASDGSPRGLIPVSFAGVVVPDGARLQVASECLLLVAETEAASRWTGFLARGDAALIGLGFGACPLLLAPVVNAVAAGDPFRRSNAARIGWTGAIVGVVGVVGMIAPMLPNLAALAVSMSFDAAGGANPFAVVFGVGLAPIGVAALIFGGCRGVPPRDSDQRRHRGSRVSRADRPNYNPAAAEDPAGATEHRVTCHLDSLLAARGLTLTELAQHAGVTVVNLSVLKNDRARAIRFSTLTAVCDALDCQPGDLLSVADSGP